MPVQVCAEPSELGSAWAGQTAELTELIGSAGLDTSATVGRLTLGGRTLAGSLDGEWRGSRVAKDVVGRQGEGGQICYAVEMAPTSAAVLLVRH